MKVLNKTLAVMALLTMAISGAQAGMLELRGGVGLSAADSDSFEAKANNVAGGGIDANEFETYNVDLFVNIPALPIGVGLRHEWLNVTDSGASGSELDLEAKNLQLLVDWRIIDTVAYVGPIIGIGHPSAEVDFKSGTANVADDLDADSLSYSAGVEAGVILKGFIVGAEAGYQSVKFDKSDNNNLNADLDLSGFYGKVMVGLSFL